MNKTTLSEGAERLWWLLAGYQQTAPYTAPGCRVADQWLAVELGVTERTVRRYRAALAAAGVLRERLNDSNHLELRLLHLPNARPTTPPMQSHTPAHIRHLLQQIEIALVSGAITLPTLSMMSAPAPLVESKGVGPYPTPLSPAGQVLSRASVGDGTRDRLSHQEEDRASLTPLLIDTPPSPALSDPALPPTEPPPPRHQVRAVVESYGVFPDSAHAIANKLVQAQYTQEEAERLLKHLWQETRGQVGLLVYRLTKRPLPPRHAIEGDRERKPAYRSEREAATKKLFREMLE